MFHQDYAGLGGRGRYNFFSGDVRFETKEIIVISVIVNLIIFNLNKPHLPFH